MEEGKVGLFLRKPTSGFNSIEEVFNQLIAYDTQNAGMIESFHVPRKGISISGLLKNLVFARKRKRQLNHISGDIHYIALALGRNTLLTIHDLQSILNTESRLKRMVLEVLWIWLPARICRRISFISNFSRQEFLKHYPRFEKKSLVIHNPAPSIPDEVIELANNHHRSSSFDLEILHVGTKPNKNLERLVEALKGRNYRLHIVGKLSHEQQQILEGSELVYTNYTELSYPELLKKYIECDVLAFISTYEGFGMPILEAQSLQLPVITSNRCSMPEVAGTGALIVDPDDLNAIREAFETLQDMGAREELIRRGSENVRRFSLGSIYNQYLEVYEALNTG